MTWRSPGRLDRQVADLWAIAVLSSIALLPLWRAVLPALPLCPLRTLTGVPCPTCGATRAVAAILDGQLLDAALYNPLVTVAALVFVIVGPLAPAWARLGRRLPNVASSPTVPARVTLGVVVAGNWAYVVASGI